MTISTQSSTNTVDNSLNFRRYAALNNVKELKKLSEREDVNIDGQGTASKKTALHVAAERGKTDALKYLISIGVQQSLKDKDAYEAKYYGQRYKEVKNIFTLVELAERSINAAKNIFPDKVKDSSKQSFEVHNRFKKMCFDGVHKEVNSMITEKKIHLMFKQAASFAKRPSEEDPKFPQFLKDVEEFINFYNNEIQNYLAKQLLLDRVVALAKKEKHGFCSCGEAVSIAFLYLKHSQETSDVIRKLEIFEIYNKKNPKYNHTLLVINREGNNIKDPGTWGDALVVDAYNEKIYYSKYADDRRIDSLIAHSKVIDISLFLTNQPPKFPKNSVTVGDGFTTLAKGFDSLCDTVDIRQKQSLEKFDL